MPKYFRICTIVNNAGQYRQMRESFAAAGFSSENSTFSLFDNTSSNEFDPYRVLSGLCANTSECYLILCHQDVRPHVGHTSDRLLTTLETLTKHDNKWAVAGNAGMDERGRQVLHLDDPHGRFRATDLPRKVVSLDENFLILRPEFGVSPSPEMSGFHFYGTDLVLNAARNKRSAYVIEFLLEHLSAGDASSPDFANCRLQFERAWRQHLLLGIVRTSTGTEIAISKYPLIERIAKKRFARNVLRSLGVSLISA